MTITFFWGFRENTPVLSYSSLYWIFTTEQDTEITEQTHSGGHLIFLIIEVLLCGGHILMSICKGHKYLHYLCLFGETYLYVCSLSVFLTNFPIMLFLSPQPFSQMNHGSIYNYTCWLFCLPRKVQDDAHCLKFGPLQKLPFTNLLQTCPKKEP